jgi:TPR repeat protein
MLTLAALVYFHVGAELLVETNPDAIKYLRKAYARGCFSALALLGICYEFGLILEKDVVQAENYYLKAVDNGDYIGAARLAFLKRYGRPGISMDLALAKKYRFKAEENPCLALNWIKNASKKGLAVAQYCLALSFHNSIGLPKNPEQAFFWCEKAAQARLSQAENLLGNMYGEGAGVPIDYNAALNYYMRAASQKEPTAMFNIGTMFERGLGVPISCQFAVDWYTRAAHLGSACAFNVLGILNEEGVLEGSCAKDATSNYMKAAMFGHSHAQYNLARCYHDGFGVEKNNSKAISWFEKAADQGHSMSLLSLATCYEFGIGANRSMVEAIKYYEKAAIFGNEPARLRLVPVVTKTVFDCAKLLLRPSASKTGIYALPFEIRMQIIENLNYPQVLSPCDLSEICQRALKGLRVDTYDMEKTFHTEVKRSCSCGGKSCTRIIHIIAGLRRLVIC